MTAYRSTECCAQSSKRRTFRDRLPRPPSRWRPRVKTTCDREGGGFSLRRAVTDCAVLPVKLDCGDEIFIGHSDRIGALSLAAQGRIQRCLRRPCFYPPWSGVRIRGMMPLRRTKYPPTKAMTIVTKTPNTNALNSRRPLTGTRLSHSQTLL